MVTWLTVYTVFYGYCCK